MRASTSLAGLLCLLSWGCRDTELGSDPSNLTGYGAGGAGGGTLSATPMVGPTSPSNDTCADPELIDLAPGEHAFAHGTFAGANADISTFCISSATPDVAYQVSVIEECTAVFTVDGGPELLPGLALRSAGCEVEESCAIAPGSLLTSKAVLTAGTYWAIVYDTALGGGDFTLSIDCRVPSCGDGVKNSGEACDDGNTLAGDGCADCQLEAAQPSIDTCAGAAASAPIVLAPASTTLVPSSGTRSTVNATDSGTGSCFYPPGVDGTIAARDHVYRVQVSAPTTVHAIVGQDADGKPFCGVSEPASLPYPAGCWDYAVSVRSGACDNQDTEVACSESLTAWWAVEDASFVAAPGIDYFVFVDGWHDDEYGSGPYVLRLVAE